MYALEYGSSIGCSSYTPANISLPAIVFSKKPSSETNGSTIARVLLVWENLALFSLYIASSISSFFVSSIYSLFRSIKTFIKP